MDGLFIGTGDLRLCMGMETGSLDGEEPIFVAALAKIKNAAKANNLPIMGFGISPSAIQRRMDMGWSAFIVHGDVDAITVSAQQNLEAYSSAANCYLLNNSRRMATKGNGALNSRL